MPGMICCLCQIPMVPLQTEFEYMGHSFNHEFLRCPSCKQVYIPEEAATGRMAAVEHELEDK